VLKQLCYRQIRFFTLTIGQYTVSLMRTGLAMLTMTSLGLAASGCSSAAPKAAAAPAPKQQSELDKLMREKMNKVFSSLIFQVFHAEGEMDFASVNQQAGDLQQVVTSVRNLQLPPMVTSDEARQVFLTYNDSLQHQADKFAEAVGRRDRANMEALLTNIGQTCNQCHHFFRLDIKDAPER
jgi:cytochrome c556